MSRPLIEISQFIQDLGHSFVIDLQKPSQAIKHGEFKGHVWVKNIYLKDKHIIVVGVYDHKTTEYARETFTDSNDALTTTELKKLSIELERVEREYQEQKQKDQEACQKYCLQEWEKATPNQPHPYLSKKGVNPRPNLRVRDSVFPGESDLLCGAWDSDGTFWGYQNISKDSKKSFPPGFKLSGSFYSAGADLNSSYPYLIICEGVATALSIAESLEYKIPVVAAFSSSNLLTVGLSLREKYGKTPIKFCADNDCWKSSGTNPGVEACKKAISAIDGAVLAIPDFSGCDQSGMPTDFNDLHNLSGLDEVKRQIESVHTSRPEYIYSLGFVDRSYFFTTLRNPGVQSFGEFTSADCFKLATIYYWKRNFPGARGGIDWDSVKSFLVSECQKKGIFEPSKIRGRGEFWDKDKMVVNLGNKLLVDGTLTDIQDFESEYYYDPRYPIELPEKSLLTKACVKQAEKLINDLPFETPSDAKILMGWLMLAPMAGALEWRPHLMLTAAAGTGKSTILNYIIEPAFRFLKPFKEEDTSAAGLRQTVKSDSCIVMLDEFDTNKKNIKQLEEMLGLIRISSSEGTMRRGSPSNKSFSFTAKFIAIMSGVNPPPLVEADRSRIHEINLTKEYKRKIWEEFRIELENFWPSMGAKIFWTGLERAKCVQESVRVLHTAISEKMGSRAGQQLGTLLAGYWAWHHDTVIGKSEAQKLVDEFVTKEVVEHRENNDVDDCFEHLLNLQIIHGEHKTSTPLAEFLESNNALDYKKEWLVNYGLGLGEKGLLVANKHPALARHFHGTPWLVWSKTLKRRGGSTAGFFRRGGIITRCVALKVGEKTDEF